MEGLDNRSFDTGDGQVQLSIPVDIELDEVSKELYESGNEIGDEINLPGEDKPPNVTGDKRFDRGNEALNTNNTVADTTEIKAPNIENKIPDTTENELFKILQPADTGDVVQNEGLINLSAVEAKTTTKETELTNDEGEDDGHISQAPNERAKDRDIWDRPVEFFLSCVAMSVGLGNFWRFPTTAYENGGGAFLIPYLCVLMFIGRPMYFLELSIGQFTSRSTVKIWNIVPAFRGIGYAQALASMCVVTYYCAIIAIAIFYLSMSFQSVLPWSICDPSWADIDTCVEVRPDTDANATTNITQLQISAEQYFKRFLLQEPADLSQGPGTPDWRLAICLFVTWILVGATLIKGVKSHGKVSYVTALFPYVGLLTLLVQGCLLPGAAEGMLYFVTPRWGEVLDAKVWYAAVTQSFFSLSVGFGPIMMFSSHNKFRHNIYRDATIISLLDTFTSLFAGFTIFSVLGYLKYITKVDSFDDIVSGGTTLVFVSYPTAIAAFETVPQLFSVLFFLVLITLGLGSSTALASVVINILHDDIGHIIRPIYLTIATCVVCFLVGLVFITPGGQWVLDLVDFFGGGFVIYILTIFETIAIFWIYGQRKYLRDMRFMLGIKLNFYWKFCYAFFIPVALTGIFIYFLVSFQLPTYNGGLVYPDIAYAFGWLILIMALGMLPVNFYFSYRKAEGSTVSERLLMTLLPNAKHRPRLESDHRGWLLFTALDGAGRDGGARIDAWGKVAVQALQDPHKLTHFNDYCRELCDK